MDFVFVHPVSALVTTETVPPVTTFVRGSTATSVPDDFNVSSPAFGLSPPQLETKSLPPAVTTAYGATPTGTRSSTWFVVKLIRWSSLPREQQTHSVVVSVARTPVG